MEEKKKHDEVEKKEIYDKEVSDIEESIEEEIEKEIEEEAIENVKKEAEDRYARLRAEFQNYKKRSAKEKEDIHAYANEKLIKDLLDVLDNFERAIEVMEKDISDNENDAIMEGVGLIFTQFYDVLKKAGLNEIKALGEKFDPQFHHAVINEPSEEFKSGEVSKVLQKGYKLNDRVIRPAMVAVSE